MMVRTAVVEIQKGSKDIYELNEDGQLVFDRHSPFPFPAHYGSILKTLAGDGDPVDVIIAAGGVLTLGEAVEVRPVGVLHMIDRKVPDEKVVAVALADAALQGVKIVDDIPGLTQGVIEQFLLDMKTMAGHEIEFNGWGSVSDAEQLISAAEERYLANV